MPDIQESSVIKGVYLVKFPTYTDDRGYFQETFRTEWFPQRRWERVQMNRSESKANVLRGLHYHFHQVDYWYVAAGSIRAALADIRPDSPTCRASQTVEMGANNPIGLFIPVGVAHGFVTLSQTTMIYIVDNYYDGDDELGVAWNDPELGVAWQVEAPIISDRDQSNPLLRDIEAGHVPRLSTTGV